jgi:hypothetical protein
MKETLSAVVTRLPSLMGLTTPTRMFGCWLTYKASILEFGKLGLGIYTTYPTRLPPNRDKIDLKKQITKRWMIVHDKGWMIDQGFCQKEGIFF